jgi:hypothetical protein
VINLFNCNAAQIYYSFNAINKRNKIVIDAKNIKEDLLKLFTKFIVQSIQYSIISAANFAALYETSFSFK